MSTPYFCQRKTEGYCVFCLVKDYKIYVTETVKTIMNYEDWPKEYRDLFLTKLRYTRLPARASYKEREKDAIEYSLNMERFAYKHGLIEEIKNIIFFSTFNEALDSYMTNFYQQSHNSVFTTSIEFQIGDIISLDDWAVHWLDLFDFDLKLESA